MSLTQVTITGADDKVDPNDLIVLSREFPFVEWGILFSLTRSGTPRYPTLPWVADLSERVERTWGTPDPVRAQFAAHFCGRLTKETQAGRRTWVRMLASAGVFHRVQLNGYDFSTDARPLFLSGIQYILQARSEADLDVAERTREWGAWRPDVLFDASGGRGIRQSGDWPVRRGESRTGWAGGIGPSNVEDVARAIAAQQDENRAAHGHQGFWLDMESGVRTDDAFDLALVREVLTKVRPFVKTREDARRARFR